MRPGPFLIAALLLGVGALLPLARHGDVPVMVGLAVLTVCAVVALVSLERSMKRAQTAADKRALDAQVSEAKFSGIVSIASDAIVSADDQHRIVIFNEGAEKIFGYRRDEIVGQPLDVLIPERFRADHGPAMRRFAAGPVTSRRMGERRAIFGLRRDGSEFSADAAISHLNTHGQRLMTVVLRDVTERTRMEAEQRLLAETGALLAASLDLEQTLQQVGSLGTRAGADVCVVYLLAPDGVPTRARVAAVDQAHAELAAQLERLAMEHHVAFLAAALRSDQPVLHPRVVDGTIGADGSRAQALAAIPVASVMALPLTARSRRIGALVMIACGGRSFGPSDLTFAGQLAHAAALAVDNANLYRAATEATRARDDVLGVVAHDLRSPLNGMILSLQALSQRLVKRGAADLNDEWVTALQGGARTMNRLIQDLLDITRMDAGRLMLQAAPCAPVQLVRHAVAQSTPLAAGLEVVSDVPDGLPDVLADEGRVLQVMANLVGNAIKFTPPHGRIVLGARLVGNSVEFRVTDNGPGIAPDQLDRIFDRFWQADNHDRRGAGLGLSIAKAIVELHGGVIRAGSTIGAGATFSFTLPVAPQEQPG